MPRAPRIEFAGAIYHVMSRRNRGDPIFRDQVDHEILFRTLSDTCKSAGWVVHSFVFMRNHYRLLIETQRATLVRGMQYLNSTYSKRYNVRHKTFGRMFQSRYKALLVDAEEAEYYTNTERSVNAMSFQTSREIAAPPSSVFAAFEDSARLQIWWGPAGFTNTFKTCEFKSGGKWSFVMHGPNGRDYPNESVFRDIEPSKRIVIQHVSKPRYLLTVTLDPTDNGGTFVRWDQEFENAKVASGIKHIVVPANEQNLDRLSAEVLHKHGGG